LSSFSDGLVSNPQAIDFFMDSLVETMWKQHVNELQEKVESSAMTSPCCGPTDVDSVNQLLDVFHDYDDMGNGDTVNGGDASGRWKTAFKTLMDTQQRSSSLSQSELRLRFLYIPTAMYALRKDSANSSGKQRQRARADGKKRRTQIARLIQEQFAQAWNEMNDRGASEEAESPVNVLTVTLDFDDGSLKQPDGSKDASKFPSTGMEALQDWKPHLIYVQGGNTFWLYHCMEKGNYRDALIDAIAVGENDQTPAVYCGTSAGAILAGSLMETATWKEWDDPSVVPDRTNYEDWKGVAGLDLAGENISIFPHMGDQWQDIVDVKIGQLEAPVPPDGATADSKDSSLSSPEVYCLRDDQVVCVNGTGPQPIRTLLEAPSTTLEQ